MFLSDKLLAFRTGPVDHDFPCRKRSEGRLKNNTSCTDIRIWSLDCEDRRKAFLDLFRTCQNCPHIGNYVPMSEVLKAIGIAAPKVRDAESPVIRCLRFIFNNFGKNDGLTVAGSGKTPPTPQTGDQTHTVLSKQRTELQPTSAQRRLMGQLDSAQTTYGTSSKGRLRSAKMTSSYGESSKTGGYPFFTGNHKVQFKSSESSSVTRVDGMKKITQSTSTIIEHVSETSETETYNTFLTGIKRGLTSTANEYSPPVWSAQKYGNEKSPRNKKDDYYYTSTSSGYPFKNTSSLGVEYNRSGQLKSNNSIKKGYGIISTRAHDHVSPEFCTEMCLYLKEQLKHVHELILKRDLLEKQLKYHENNLPKKIMITKRSPDRKLHGGTESESSVSAHKTYSANPVQKNRKYKMEASKQNHKSPHRVIKTKSRERKLQILKSSVFTTNATAASSSEIIETSKPLYSHRHILPCNLEEFDKFVNEVKHVLSGVLKQFEVSDETVQSLSEEKFIRSYIEETPEYRLDISQMGKTKKDRR